MQKQTYGLASRTGQKHGRQCAIILSKAKLTGEGVGGECRWQRSEVRCQRWFGNSKSQNPKHQRSFKIQAPTAVGGTLHCPTTAARDLDPLGDDRGAIPTRARNRNRALAGS